MLKKFITATTILGIFFIFSLIFQTKVYASTDITCPDTNGDGKINSIDLLIVVKNQRSTTPGNPADVNHDGKVNSLDLLIVVKNQGLVCPSTLVVINHVIKDSGGTLNSADFTINVTGTKVSLPSFPGAESPGTTVTLTYGSYSIDSTYNPTAYTPGYVKTLGANCTGTIKPGETKTCTITNDDNSPYSVISLGTLGGLNSGAAGINNNSQVVGTSTTSQNQPHAFLYQNGNMSDLGTINNASGESNAFGINDGGIIVGTSSKQVDANNRPYRAVEWVNGQITELDTGAPNIGHSVARAINNNGVIVGETATSTAPYYPTHAFMWKNGVTTDLGTLGGLTSFATDININEQVVGYSYDANNIIHGFVWENGHMTQLPDPTDVVNPYSWANSINDQGVIVGYGEGDTGGAYALKWQNGSASELGLLDASSDNPNAISVNAIGEIVGQINVNGQARPRHPFIWKNGVMTDLAPNILDYNYGVAGVNDNGQIVGSRSGVNSVNGEALLWTPNH